MAVSTLPPNLVGPLLQSHLVQQQVSRVRDNERAQELSARRKQSSAIDQQESTVETTDNDTQVHAEAEGTGSQGRPFSSPEEQQPPPENKPTGDEIEGRLLDLEA